MNQIEIKNAQENDIPLILTFIKELAFYEKLAHVVVATEEHLREHLFGTNPKAEVVLAYYEQVPVGFALFFHNFSTFVGRPGIYLEDLFVRETMRGKGIGKALLAHLAHVAIERNCGRFEWAVLDWNSPAIEFYKSLGAVPVDDWTIFRVSGDALQHLARKK
ncbi:GNAT family N-acetyltransferase [bacterium]|nr:GNAT family N-acetyltransferase [bacterium]